MPKNNTQPSRGDKEAVLLIPLSYNDGSRVPTEIIQAIHDEVFAAFTGWTIAGTVKGAYRMRSGEKKVEDLLKVSIVLSAAQIQELEKMIAGWCVTLGQETMLLKITDATIRFITPRQPKDEP